MSAVEKEGRRPIKRLMFLLLAIGALISVSIPVSGFEFLKDLPGSLYLGWSVIVEPLFGSGPFLRVTVSILIFSLGFGGAVLFFRANRLRAWFLGWVLLALLFVVPLIGWLHGLSFV